MGNNLRKFLIPEKNKEQSRQRGLAGTRVREIAEGAGVNVATLYNYYPRKDAVHACAKTRFTIEKTRTMKGWGLYCPNPFSI